MIQCVYKGGAAMKQDIYGPIVDQIMAGMTPEAILAHGGREGMIREMKQNDRKRGIIVTIKNFGRSVWNLTKAVILIFTVFYFINAIFF